MSTYEEMAKRFQGLHIICNGCGEIMRDMGSWPANYPRQSEHTLITWRYVCSTCRVPSPLYERGLPVIVSIVDDA